jgi:V/A-type H+-transporting ATPase subunit I
MSIEKMKRLRLLGLRSDREELLRALQRLGCVEISEPAIDLSDPAWAVLAKPEGRGLATAKEEHDLLAAALSILGKYAPAKDGLLQARPELSEGAFFDNETYRTGLEAARSIVEGERTLAAHQAELG